MTTQSILVNADNFLLEVDHLLIYTMEGLTDVSILQELGLHNSSQIVRREEQGTASTLFFFENTYLELIWIEDENRAKQYSARTGINILERACWRQTAASPFGVGLRCKSSGVDNLLLSSISNSWAEWMCSDTSINFSAENLATVEEPICFTIPNNIALTTWLDRTYKNHQQLISHPLGVRKITGVKITLSRHGELTNAVSLLKDNGIIAFERGTFPLLELTFDENANRKVVDARPILPVVLKY